MKKRIESFHCTLWANGTYQLTFNTRERWEEIHRANSETYCFGPEGEEEIEFEPFLPELPGGRYIPSMLQDKYLVYFFFMPLKDEDRGMRVDVGVVERSRK